MPASAWVKGHSSNVRLIAGASPSAVGARTLYGGVDIRLADGWKTYWRHPGDDGGIPPSFDWSASRNLKSATVKLPAPERLKSLNGTALGYNRSVIFPVEIEPADPARPVDLVVTMEFGVCREICIPAEAKLSLTIPATLSSLPPDLAAALQRVPQPLANPGTVIKAGRAALTGPSPSLTFDIATGVSGGRTDLFVESPGGGYLPVPQKIGDPVSGVQRFRIDLKGVDDIAALSGKELRLTMTAVGTPSEARWTVKP